MDAGAGCLIVYEEQSPDHTHEHTLETLGNMSKVVDALSFKANQITVPTEVKLEGKDSGLTDKAGSKDGNRGGEEA